MRDYARSVDGGTVISRPPTYSSRRSNSPSRDIKHLPGKANQDRTISLSCSPYPTGAPTKGCGGPGHMAHLRSITKTMVLTVTLTINLSLASAQTNSGRRCEATCERGTITETKGCGNFAGTRCAVTGCISRLQKATLLGVCVSSQITAPINEVINTYELAQKEAWCESTANNYKQTTTKGSYLRITDAGSCMVYTEGPDPTYRRCAQAPFAILGTTTQGIQRVCCLRQCSGDPTPTIQPVVPAPLPPPVAPSRPGHGPQLGAPIFSSR